MSYHVIYCGQGGCGKTFAAMTTSAQAFRQERRRSIVYDPNGYDWGRHAIVFTGGRVGAFWDFAWRQRNCFVYVDEVVTSMPRDADCNEHFTRIRHRGHQLHMLLHVATNLLPMQRGQANTLYLFNQDPASAKVFASEWNEPRALDATTLRKREFINFQKFADPLTGFHLMARGEFPPNDEIRRQTDASRGGQR